MIISEHKLSIHVDNKLLKRSIWFIKMTTTVKDIFSSIVIIIYIESYVCRFLFNSFWRLFLLTTFFFCFFLLCSFCFFYSSFHFFFESLSIQRCVLHPFGTFQSLVFAFSNEMQRMRDKINEKMVKNEDEKSICHKIKLHQL